MKPSLRLSLRAHTMIPVAISIALPLVLYAPFLVGGQVLYWGVYLLQFHPWRQLAVEQIRAGHWPLWNPYLGAGTPLAANLQTATFYPPNALFLLMPVERAFGWELALHVTLAGLFTYYLGRTLGLGRFGALISGLTYAGGGYLIARWVFPSMVYAAAWLPLMLALTEKVVRHATPNSHSSTRYWLLDIALLALTIALQLLAGHAQTSFYSLVLVAVFALFRALHHASRLTPHVSRIKHCTLRLAWVALTALWGVALAAIQLLSTAELAANSQRAGALTDLRFAFELSFWPWRLITLLAPDFFGNPARDEYWAYGNYWEGAAFIGVLSLLLAALALVQWWRKRADASQGPLSQVPFFALLSLLSLVLALGNHTPLYPLLFHWVPGFGLFQAPARLTLGYALGMALLAGIGADALRISPRTRAVLRIAVVIGLGIGIAGVLVRLILPDVRSSFGNSTIRLGLTLALAAGLLLLRGRRLRGGRWQALVVALVFADLAAFGWGLTPGTDPAVYRTPVASAGFLQSQPPGRVFVAYPYAQQTYDEYVSLRSFGSADPAYLQHLRESLLPNLNVPHHLPGVGNYDPLTISLYRDLWDRFEGEREAPPALDEILPLLNLFGARYIVDDTTSGLVPLPSIYDGGPHIYRNDAALPDALVVSQARVVEDRAARLAALLDPAFDPRVEVLLSHAPASFPSRAGGTEGGQTHQLIASSSPPQAGGTEGGQTHQPTASILRQGPDQVTIQVDASQPGYLVLADIYYPGWRATVDGEPAEILPANHAFRAVGLDAGKHTVVFKYAPQSFRLGAWITLGAALLLAAVLLATWLHRRGR